MNINQAILSANLAHSLHILQNGIQGSDGLLSFFDIDIVTTCVGEGLNIYLQWSGVFFTFVCATPLRGTNPFKDIATHRLASDTGLIEKL